MSDDLISRAAAIAVANAETWEYPQDDADAGNNYAVSRIVEGLRALPSATQAGGWMPPEDHYLVWSHEHGCWWRANSQGYTNDVRSAGIYTRDEAVSISHNARDRWRPGHKPDELPVRLSDMPEWVQAAFAPLPPAPEGEG